MITYVKGDVLKAFDESTNCILMHQENCISIKKSGFAKILYDKFPEAHIQKRLPGYFGDVIFTQVSKDKFVYNLYSQYYPSGPKGEMCTFEGFRAIDDYETRIKALEKCLYKVESHISETNRKILLPLIGSGLAKDKSKSHFSDLDYFMSYIGPTVDKILGNFDINVYYL